MIKPISRTDPKKGRLFYVAVTRAESKLTSRLCSLERFHADQLLEPSRFRWDSAKYLEFSFGQTHKTPPRFLMTNARRMGMTLIPRGNDLQRLLKNYLGDIS